MADERDNVRNGKQLLIAMQRELVHVPKKRQIPALVADLVKKAHLRHTKRERYFSLWAYVALMGLDPFYFYFKRRGKHGDKIKAEEQKLKASQAAEENSSKEGIKAGKESRSKKKGRHYRRKRR